MLIKIFVVVVVIGFVAMSTANPVTTAPISKSPLFDSFYKAPRIYIFWANLRALLQLREDKSLVSDVSKTCRPPISLLTASYV